MRSILASVMAWFAPLMADAASTVMDQAPNWIGPLVGGSFTVWYAWHTTYKTIPALVSEARADQKQARDDFSAALAKVIDHAERNEAKYEERYMRAMAAFPCQVKGREGMGS